MAANPKNAPPGEPVGINQITPELRRATFTAKVLCAALEEIPAKGKGKGKRESTTSPASEKPPRIAQAITVAGVYVCGGMLVSVSVEAD